MAKINTTIIKWRELIPNHSNVWNIVIAQLMLVLKRTILILVRSVTKKSNNLSKVNSSHVANWDSNLYMLQTPVFALSPLL
jgi:hypothetical protein